MQDRYVGDVGDYVKYSLLRSLMPGKRLGVAWYLYPSEAHNSDGKHVLYLRAQDEWREYDRDCFDTLAEIVRSNNRSTSAIERSGLLGQTTFANQPLAAASLPRRERHQWRVAWFSELMRRLSDCDLVFSDPDNGLCTDEKFNAGKAKSHKRMPLGEALAISGKDRTTIVYHHNSRFKGGHLREIAHWQGQLPKRTAAIYWHRWSNRTFFLINPTDEIQDRAIQFVSRWQPHASWIPALTP